MVEKLRLKGLFSELDQVTTASSDKRFCDFTSIPHRLRIGTHTPDSFPNSAASLHHLEPMLSQHTTP